MTNIRVGHVQYRPGGASVRRGVGARRGCAWHRISIITLRVVRGIVTVVCVMSQQGSSRGGRRHLGRIWQGDETVGMAGARFPHEDQ